MVREEVMTFSEAYPLSDCFKRYLKIKTVWEESCCKMPRKWSLTTLQGKGVQREGGEMETLENKKQIDILKYYSTSLGYKIVEVLLL